ncbi:putative porin [Parahaliea sp. F7430]|uniref:Putative porin n=1 Tax=Sediminihaliea albiluteola TaxID=2758564 RepID=A0A7W2TUX8_9GAMM|nr:putative porin [Sediminihaliea albiluteola]MBA6412419.1 putative porin [Sediminihaliea albiluteola]
MRARWILFGLLIALSPAFAQAEVSAAQLEQLRAEFSALAQRLQVLEAENAELKALVEQGALQEEPSAQQVVAATSSLSAAQPAAKPSAGPEHWTDRFSLSGDFRYRYQEVKVDDMAGRDRHRIRARAELKARLDHGLTVATGFSTGGDNPLSANQTLGSGGTKKDLHLSLAYVQWQPNEQWSLSAGKIHNPFYRPEKTGLLWDGDYKLEGFSAQWSNDLLFANAAMHLLESDNKGGNQQATWGLQGGVNLSLGPVDLKTGLGYFDLPVKGKESFYGDVDDFYGNSFVCGGSQAPSSCIYQYDYRQLEWFVDMGFDLANLPVKLYADVVNNRAVDELDMGWLVGVKLGKASLPGSWQLGYEYLDLEADAVLALLSDSDFAGGGSDGKGHKFFGIYAPYRNVQFKLSYYPGNEKGVDLADESIEIDRLVFDASIKY